MRESAILALEDGTIFHGESVGVSTGFSVGEVVFNTAMTGYQEVLTDPSYAQQLVTLTYPHIGNTGFNEEDNESDKVHAAGLIIRDLPELSSNWRSQGSLDDFLQTHNTLAIAGIDTRKLTRILREKGAQNGCLMAGEIDPEQAVLHAQNFSGLKGKDLAQTVTTSSPFQWLEGSCVAAPHEAFNAIMEQQGSAEVFKVVAYDFGVKRNILRLLVDSGCDVTVVPAQTPADTVLAMSPDGVFLSNGPGDPEPCEYALQAIKVFLAKKVPLFGICLGHQLLALASGASTLKMKFGHHGANHPVQDLSTKKVLITSQNHGFSVDESSLPECLRPTYRSLFDGSLQGIERTDVPAFSFQGHPEASPGPVDIDGLFAKFTALMQQHKHSK